MPGLESATQFAETAGQITFASHWKPRSRRQFFSALMPSLKTIESMPSRVRHPLVRSVRCLMVANVDSMELLV